jgi:hypothetical protein
MKNDGCPSLQVGGVEDHVHPLFVLSRTRSLAQVVENVKTSSLKWLKSKSPALADFHWQNGYGVFSVGRSEVDGLINYIRHQEDHHRTATFQEEYRRFLIEHSIDFDERYVWDWRGPSGRIVLGISIPGRWPGLRECGPSGLKKLLPSAGSNRARKPRRGGLPRPRPSAWVRITAS